MHTRGKEQKIYDFFFLYKFQPMGSGDLFDKVILLSNIRKIKSKRDSFQFVDLPCVRMQALHLEQ